MAQLYQRVSYEQRCQISALLQTKISVQAIAKRLGVHRSTIYREMGRSRDEDASYRPEFAQAEALELKKRCRRRRVLSDPALLRLVTIQLKKEHLSPEQIAGRFGFISHQTIYNAVHGEHSGLGRYLRRYGKRRGRGRKGRRKPRKRAPWFVSIKKRPLVVEKRNISGHWERDTMYVRDRKMMLVCIERRSRFVRIEKLKKIEPRTVYAQSLQMMHIDGKSPLTMTNDNGAEFMGNTDAKVPIYFCDPYSPHQRGSIENAIGLIRQYLKLTTDIRRLSNEKLRAIEAKINHRPRKCLGYKTPHEMMFSTLSR